jgi:hypothetical protein
MRNILFIILLGFLTSCAQSNVAINPDGGLDDIKGLEEAVQENITDTISQIDTIEFHREFIVDEMKRMPIEREPVRLRTQDEVRVIEDHEVKTQLKVIDRTSIQSTGSGNTGWIAYSIPEEMKVQKNYSVKVRISKKYNQSKAELILGNEDAINNPDYPSIAMIEDVKVSGEMSAELRGDADEFKIVSLSTPTQNIDDESYTEWEWVVKPLKSGQSPLKLVVKVKDFNKDIVVFNRNIKIKSNVPVAVESFFDKYWQWIMTTIIIPIFLYFWNRKRRKTKKS